MNNRPAKTFFLITIVIVTSIALMNLITAPSVLGGTPPKVLTSYELNEAIFNKNIVLAEWQERTFSGVLKPDQRFTAKVVDVNSLPHPIFRSSSGTTTSITESPIRP